MSEENVEIVRRSFEVFNRDGIAALFSGGIFSSELLMDGSRTGIPGVGAYRGHDEVITFFEEDWFAAFPFAEWEIVVDDLVDHGDRVVSRSRQRGRGSSSGAAAELELANVHTLRDGQIVRIEVYRDRKQALEAAGLSE
jgi:ketosteroid isomerase-like protein